MAPLCVSLQQSQLGLSDCLPFNCALPLHQSTDMSGIYRLAGDSLRHTLGVVHAKALAFEVVTKTGTGIMRADSDLHPVIRSHGQQPQPVAIRSYVGTHVTSVDVVERINACFTSLATIWALSVPTAGVILLASLLQSR